MGTSRTGRVSRPRGAVTIPLVTLILLAALGVGGYQLGWFNDAICDGPCSAAYVEPPEAITDPVEAAVVAPAGSDAGPADSAKVVAAVRSALEQPALGGHVGFVALDEEFGDTLVTSGAGAFIPASTTKVITSFAALSVMDADTRFATRVVGASDSELVLVGGGDPFLGVAKPRPFRYAHPATLTDLAKRTAAALEKSGTTSVSLAYDDSLFSGPDVSPSWEDGYITGNVVTPISALWADKGIVNGVRSRNPAQSAAASFAKLLEKRGIEVDLGSRTTAPAEGREIARVESGTVSQILEQINQQSDNEGAEVMLRQLAIAKDRPGSFTDGVDVVRDALADAGVDTAGLVLFDGSGLSRDNRISPLTLAQTIRMASLDPRTGSLTADLPIGGFNGSTLNRFQSGAGKQGKGSVRAKTGTLSGVHSLAGIVRDADGRAIVFAAMTDGTKSESPFATQVALDNIAGSLAACRCGS